MARRPHRRGQRDWHFVRALFKLTILAAALGAAGFYGFRAGEELGAADVATVQSEVHRLNGELAARQEELGRVQADRDAQKARADDMAARYAEVAPSDDMRELTAALRARLDAGLDARRLAFVIANADRPKRCGAAATKRFLVRTSKAGGAATWVRFADVVTVSAEGTAGGGADPSFDPDKPVTVRFVPLGGKESQVSGKLPLQHAMVVKGVEYRFTVTPGTKGFVEVTGDRCDYRG